ncbi:24169_t:CDS:2 [Entrophospora sp. SA101]|nr:24169_t:CDS:2 [Entrophospora sp. SA101]
MESKFAHKRVIEPKYMRKKVVFVDPDDPSASYWWPALVVPNKEIEIFKQKIDIALFEMPVSGWTFVAVAAVFFFSPEAAVVIGAFEAENILKLDTLPPEIIIAICRKLSLLDKCSVSKVCKCFQRIIYNNLEFWRFLDLSPFSENLTNQHLFNILRTRWKSNIKGQRLDLSGCQLINSYALEKLAAMYSDFQGIHLNNEPPGRPGLYQKWRVSHSSLSSKTQPWIIGDKSIQLIIQKSYKTLSHLSLGNQKLRHETATAIASCSQLLYLDLCGTDLNDASLQDILTKTNKLESLKLLDIELTPMTLMIIRLLKNLRLLHISGLNKKNLNSRSISDTLKNLSNLQNFRMNQTMIGEVDRVIIEGLSWVFCDGPVETFNVMLENNRNNNNGTSVKQNRTSLRYLDLSPKLDIYPRSQESHVQIEHYITISNSSLWSLSVNHPFLVSLRIFNAYAISAEGIDVLLSNLHYLEYLELRRWRGMDLDPINRLTPSYCPKLKEIVLHGIEISDFDEWIKVVEIDQKNDDDSITKINYVGFRNLEVLDLTDISGYCDKHFDFMVVQCSKLHKVRLLKTEKDKTRQIKQTSSNSIKLLNKIPLEYIADPARHEEAEMAENDRNGKSDNLLRLPSGQNPGELLPLRQEHSIPQTTKPIYNDTNQTEDYYYKR